MRQRAITIAILGATGVGKSTLAHSLAKKLDIRYSTGSGVILNVYRSLKPKHPALRSMSAVDPSIPLPKLKKILFRQARLLAPAVNFVLKKYSATGVPFIIEGRHVFPPFLNQRYLTLCITVAAPPRKYYLQWLNHPTSKMRLEPYPLQLAKKINQILLEQARKSHIPIIRTTDIGKRVGEVISLLNRATR